jgi:putative RNA 2'-phosphotransferase
VDPNEYRLSRVMSLVLRHAPEQFGLRLDDQGFVAVEELSKALAERFPFATTEFIQQFVAGSGSRRFVIQEGRVAARYGHSIPVTLDSVPVDPPEFLFLGSSPHLRDKVLSQGLLPDQRKWVHLSATEQEARSIGQRKSRTPMILRIHTARAREQGIEFFQAGHLYLCREVPPEAVEVIVG